MYVVSEAERALKTNKLLTLSILSFSTISTLLNTFLLVQNIILQIKPEPEQALEVVGTLDACFQSAADRSLDQAFGTVEVGKSK